MFRFLPQSHALSKGSSLWIIQEPPQSFLAKKIDWHLQCIFRKLKTSNTMSIHKALLIESSMHLPCRQVLFLHCEKKSPLEWIRQSFQNWKKLGSPSLKLFLPKNLTKEDLTNHWPFEALPYKIHVILESNVQ